MTADLFIGVGLVVTFLDGLYWWRRSRHHQREAQKWRAVAEHCQRALAARSMLDDARRRALN